MQIGGASLSGRLVAFSSMLHLYQYSNYTQDDCLASLLSSIMISLLLVTSAAQLTPQAVNLPSDRSASMTATCARTTIVNITADDFDSALPYLRMMPNFTYNPVRALMTNNMTASSDIFLAAQDYYMPFILPGAIGLILLFPLSMFVLCVCACPQSCPTKSCRNQTNDYTKSELALPTGIGILLILVAMCSSVPSLLRTNSSIDSFNYLGCSIQRFIDNSVNGRVSNDTSSFFAGTVLINQSVSSMQKILSSLTNNAQSAIPNVNSIILKGNNAISSIKNTYNSYTDISYVNIFRDSSANYLPTVNSIFKNTYLGPFTNSSTITGILLSTFEPMTINVSSVILPLQSSVNSLSSITTLNNQFQAGIASLNAYNLSAERSMKTVQSIFSNTDGLSGLKWGLFIYFGLIIVCSLIAMCGLFAMFSCGVFQFRKLIFCSCGFLTVLAYLGFLLSILLGICIPTVYFMNSQIGLSINNSTHMNLRLQNLGMSERQAMTLSSAAGTGQFLKAFDSTLADRYQKFKLIFDSSIKFQQLISGYSDTKIQSANQSAYAIFTNVMENSFYDISDANALRWLSLIASGTISTNSNCNANPGSQSWVPSFNVSSPLCRSGVIKRTLCTDISSTTTCPVGCYPFTQQLSTTTSGDSSNDWLNRLKTRYNVVGALSDCNYATFIYQLSTWDTQRKNNIKALQLTMNGSSSMMSHLNGYISEISTIKASLKTFSTSLTNTIPGTVDSKNGVMAGLNSSALSIDLFNVYGAGSYLLFSNLFFLMICVQIISWSLCLSLGPVMCSIYRHGRMFTEMISLMSQVHPIMDDSTSKLDL